MNIFHDLPPRIAAFLFKGVIVKGPPGGVYLTFDDGPDPDTTPALLRILTALNCRATFFLTANRVVRHPEIVRTIVESGQDIGSHSFSHKSLLFASKEAITAELLASLEAIETASGIRPGLFRPPYGRLNRRVVAVAKEIGLTTVLWSLSGADWKETVFSRLSSRIVDRVGDGDIILLHDSGKGARTTLEAVPTMIAGIREKGLRFAPLTGPIP